MSVINTNLTALKSQQNLKQSQSSLSTSIERLSSGLRVNSAKDDAAGLSISNRMQAQRTGLNQAARNANDGVSLSQTAHGVLDRINDKLQRVRELTVQSLSSGPLNITDRDSIQAEINQNLMEIDRLAESSEYNGIPLMTGQAGKVGLQVGANDGENLGVDLSPPGFSVDALGLTDFNVAGEPGTVTPRDMLYGPADDIVLEDSRTDAFYPAGAAETLYALGDNISLAGDHKREAAAIDTYYVSTGGGNFSRVSVSATHETSTDQSVVNITNPEPIFKTDWSLDETYIDGLNTNQKVVKADDTYYIETDNNDVLSYQEAEFEVSFEDTNSPTATVSGGATLDGNYQATSSFDFDGNNYELTDYRNVRYQDSNDNSLSPVETELVEDKDNSGAYYLKNTSGSDPSYYRLNGISIEDNLDVEINSPTSLSVGDEVVEFDINSNTYSINNYDKVSYSESDITKIIQSHKDDRFYAVDSSDQYFEITAASATTDTATGADNLDVTVNGPISLSVGESVTTFTPPSDSNDYDVSSGNYDNLVYSDSGTEITVNDVIRSYEDDTKFYAVDSDGNYREITEAKESQDLFLKADEQAYSGVDVEKQADSFDPDVDFTPVVPDFSTATKNFAGNDFSDIIDGSQKLIRSTSNDQWIIQGDLPGGGYGYYDADLDVSLDEQGNPTAYTVTTTDKPPTILGVDDHVVDKVHGISTVTIDPRNVSVEYTDIEGRSYSNVLTEGEDGNYYFELPGESSLRGGYKTATLVDHDQKGEIVLRTENGYSEVVVYYPTELEKGVNRAFFVQTDGDGFSNTGTPHTRLRIQEVGEDFRIQVPRNPLAALDKAIGMVDSKRSYLGAVENRLESAIDANELTSTNLASAQSRIMDADYAKETANMSRAQILQQAGNSMLAQANITPESVLALLS